MSRSSVQKLGIAAILALTTSVILAMVFGSPSSYAKAGTTFGSASKAGAESAAPVGPLVPDPAHERAVERILRNLARYHYQNVRLDNEMSQKLFDHYLKVLDRQRIYFTASDIASFEPYRLKLDEALDEGSLEAAFFIYNRYLERHKGRLNYALSTVANGAKGVNFAADELLQLDRSKERWAGNDAELDNLWDKLIKNDLLNRRLAGDEMGKAVTEVERRYRNRLHRLEQTNNLDVFETFVNAYTTIYDPHTRYMPPRESENFDIQMRLSLQGIGAMLESDGEYTKVVSLVPGGPAEASGLLKPADRIVGVAQGQDGSIVNAVGMRLDEVVDLIRGPRNSIVRLELIRTVAGEDQPPKEINITRNVINLADSRAQSQTMMIKRDGRDFKLGVIEIPKFYVDFDGKHEGKSDYRSVSRDVAGLIRELQKDGIDGLVIDLRNNSGGSLDEVNELVGLFITRGPTVQIRYAGNKVQALTDSDPGMLYNGPLAVMVNRLSASASEIFAGAMQDYERAVVIGGQTFGKGTVQTLKRMNEGRLKFTQAKFYRISGGSTQNKGVEPDIQFPVIFDTQQIGESALPDALPWDTIPPAKYLPQGRMSSLLPQLLQRHAERVKDSSEFGYLREQADYLRERRAEKYVSLNEVTRRAEREANQNRRLMLENRRRVARNLPAWKDYAEFEGADTEKDADEIDAPTKESGEILLDMIQLSSQQLVRVSG